MSNTADMPAMTALASLIDQLQALAEEHVPGPRTCRIRLWEDGDYHITISHYIHPDERKGLYYDSDTGDVIYAHTKDPYWEVAPDAEGPGTAYDRKYEEKDEEVLVTIEPPV